jgi:signal transduction histidine kinase
VSEFSLQRETVISRKQSTELNARLGFLVHELRNSLGTANLAISALELGNMTMNGATGAVLKRSLSALTNLVNLSLADVRARSAQALDRETFSLAAFITEAGNAAELEANARGCILTVAPVDALLGVCANREQLQAALANLLHNAFKFTRVLSEISLTAYAVGDRVLIDVADHCGGLPHGDTERLFAPFAQSGEDRTGLGLGLSIARQSVEADDGKLTARDVPGTGCVFTIDLPRHVLH